MSRSGARSAPRLVAGALAVVLLSAVPAVAAEPDVTADGAVLWDPLDDRVLWAHSDQQPLPPASTTKIMTVLLALEAGTIDDVVAVSQKAVGIGRRPGAANLGLDVGQRIAMRSLLAGLVLRSGNDAAVAVAEHVAGSEEAFVDKMNARAAELGLDSTSFVNASGLTDNPAHRSSARDLARLAEVALSHEEFASWAAASTMDVPGLGTLANRNELLRRYPGADGVKTGFTNDAGLCLVASAHRDGRPLIAVVLGSAGGLGASTHFTESAAILDHGFVDFRRAQPAAANQRVTRYRWSDAVVGVVATDTLGRTLRTRHDAVWRTIVDPAVPRPVHAGDQLGRAELVVDGTVVDTTALTAARDVPAPPPAAGARAAGRSVQDTLRAFARLHVADRSA